MPTAELSRIPTGEIPVPAQADRGKKIAFIAIGAVALVAAGVGGAFVVMGGGPDTGSVEIRTVPEANAEIRIDGTVRGNAPARISEIPSGTRIIEVIAEGYRAVRREVEVGAGTTAMLDIVLIGEQPPVAVASNAQPTEMTGAGAINAPPTTNPGAETETETPMVEPTMEEPAMVETMAPVVAMAMTTEMAVETPMIQRIEMGTAIMRITMAETMTSTMMRGRGGRGTLVVNSHPWSQVFVDGRRRGNTPLPSLAVPAGSHRVELRTSDGRTHRETVEVEANETARVIHRF